MSSNNGKTSSEPTLRVAFLQTRHHGRLLSRRCQRLKETSLSTLTILNALPFMNTSKSISRRRERSRISTRGMGSCPRPEGTENQPENSVSKNTTCTRPIR